MTDTATEGKQMKLHIAHAGESVWAEELGDNTCRVNNLPFFTDAVGYDDIVKYTVIDGIRTFVEVVEKKTESWGVTWTPTDGKVDEEWKQICDHLHSLELRFESACAGAFVIALPADKPQEESVLFLKSVAYSCPVELTPYIGLGEEV